MSLALFNESAPYIVQTIFTNATGTAKTNITTASFPRKRVDQILCANTDTIAHVVNLSIEGAASTIIESISVPAGVGSAGVAPMNILANLNLLPVAGVYLDGTTNLAATLEVILTATKTLSFMIMGGYL
jgi:hypothetical protein